MVCEPQTLHCEEAEASEAELRVHAPSLRSGLSSPSSASSPRPFLTGPGLLGTIGVVSGQCSAAHRYTPPDITVLNPGLHGPHPLCPQSLGLLGHCVPSLDTAGCVERAPGTSVAH